MRKSSGFSLIETAIVLGVVGVVIGGIWVLVATIRQNSLASDTVTETVNLVTNIRGYYAGRPLPTSLDEITTDLAHAGVFPTEICSDPCVVSPASQPPRNPYGGAITVNPAVVAGGVYNAVEIVYMELDAQGCIELGAKLSGQAQRIGLIQFYTSSTISTPITSFPMSVSDLQSSICTGGSPLLVVGMTFLLRH